MSDGMQPRPRRRRMGPFHWAVLAIWACVAGWLIASVAGSVVSAVFFGAGPVDAQGAPLTFAPGAAPAPPDAQDPPR
ncbi:MAG: hypothetical protein H6744_07185 [Deltaproteobacteria bacterium]|nr:hypothetical protein [Deltaproteobacteria bacterium]MCB9786462.1 hypothetical protein [Deltaproteobacteria bacterium]